MSGPVVDVVVRSDYRVGFEQFQQHTFVHVAVAARRWNARVARAFRRDIDAAHALLGRPVYAIDNAASPRLRHFLKLHGFVPCGRATNAQGLEVGVYGRPIGEHGVEQWRP